MKLKKTLAVMATAGSGLTLALVGVAGPASAATGTYGYNGNASIAVGGGSDTTYKAMTALASIYDTSSIAGCSAQTAASNPQSPALNQCISAANPTTSNANNDRDTIVQASPTGSSAGIASLNGDASIGGTDTPGTYSYSGSNGTVDFARSSRAPKTAGGNCAGGNELTCDTFWGFAEDGVQVFGFGTHGGVALSSAELYRIWSCQDTTWGAVLGTSDTAPVVPWAMNTSSGTYATFNTYLQGNGAPSGFTVDTDQVTNSSGVYTPTAGKCVRQLAGNSDPFENDVKPLFADTQANGGGLTTSGNFNDPDNWVWFGSFGLLSAFPYDNNYTFTPSGGSATTFTGSADSIDGTFPSTGAILSMSYPIDRTLYHVTLKTAADCPVDSGSTTCDFTGNPGPSVTSTTGSTVSDLNVTGATSGPGKAVREFTRFLCRASAAQDPVDPYTGNSLFSEVGQARSASGFTAVPASQKTAGTSCQVLH